MGGVVVVEGVDGGCGCGRIIGDCALPVVRLAELEQLKKANDALITHHREERLADKERETARRLREREAEDERRTTEVTQLKAAQEATVKRLEEEHQARLQEARDDFARQVRPEPPGAMSRGDVCSGPVGVGALGMGSLRSTCGATVSRTDKSPPLFFAKLSPETQKRNFFLPRGILVQRLPMTQGQHGDRPVL